MKIHQDFIQNKYFKLYLAIIDNRIQNQANSSIYTENHHILPESMGGTKEKSNMVRLYAREHFVAHKLLAKCTSGNSYYKMLSAISYFKNNGKRNLKFTSRDFETMRIAKSIATSKQFKGKKQSPELINKRSQSMTGNIHTPEHRENNRLAKMGHKQSPESIDKRRQALLGKKRTTEQSQNQSNRQKGVKRSAEFSKNQSSSRTGLKHTAESRENMGKGKIGLKYKITEVECPHCGLIGNTSNMTKYHNDNCKYQHNRIHSLLNRIEKEYVVAAGHLKAELVKIRSVLVFQQMVIILKKP